MRKSGWLGALGIAAAIGAVWAAAAVARAEKPVVIRAGNVIFTVNGNASPTRLPRHGLAPVSFHASGRIEAADGGHPPALKEAVLDVGKAGAIEAAKFPSCSPRQIEARDTGDAEAACRDAIVGSGRAEVEVLFPESSPFRATGPLVLFNGGMKNGKALLLIHAYVSVPAPTAIVTRVVTTREHKGPYRLHSVTSIPLIANGSGSPTYFFLNITRRGYLTANCDNGHFSAHISAGFRDGTVIEGSFQRPCTPIG
jgi:hypothetical protein